MIIECSILQNNLDLSESRVNLFGNIVDKFLFFVKEPVGEDLLKNLKDYNREVDIYEMDNFGDLDEIRQIILDMDLSYEDVIVFSQENEFIDYNQYNQILDRLYFSPVVVKHKKFVDDGILINFERKNGSLIFFNHQIKNKKDLLQTMISEKESNSFNFSLTIESGFLS